MNNTEEKILINNFEIKEVLPCFITQGYIRFTAQADNELGKVMSIIFLKNPPAKANYLINQNILTLRLFNRTLTLYPSGKIGVNNTKDIDEAHEILNEIKKMSNQAYREFLKNGKPKEKEIESARKITWMELFKYLPKTNCGKCGFPICSSFSVSVLQGDSSLSQCVLLKKTKYSSNIKKLKEKYGHLLISSLGWK
ncbi:MAG: (Fe-S)-binding protein [Promethearchaeota archaeon]